MFYWTNYFIIVMKKPKAAHKAYLYLARRDKKGAKLVANVKSNIEIATRVPDVKTLNLPPEIEKNVEKIVYENRMEWELWIETVDTYKELKDKLYKRGYSQVSVSPIPMLAFANSKPVNDKKLEKPPKTMLQRGK